MDPKEKKVKEEELNVEETLNNAEEQPQDEQAENAAPMTHEEELEKELETAQETIEEQKDKYLRLSAEFDNYRKRTMTVAKRALAVFFRWWMISNVLSKRWKRLRMSKL